jgi:hypothetical protein
VWFKCERDDDDDIDDDDDLHLVLGLKHLLAVTACVLLPLHAALTSQYAACAASFSRSFLNYWEKKYKHIWEIDKEAYIRRYEKAGKSLAAFEADIARYVALQVSGVVELRHESMGSVRHA